MTSHSEQTAIEQKEREVEQARNELTRDLRAMRVATRPGNLARRAWHELAGSAQHLLGAAAAQVKMLDGSALRPLTIRLHSASVTAKREARRHPLALAALGLGVVALSCAVVSHRRRNRRFLGFSRGR